MAGTQTTVLVKGDPVEDEGIGAEAISVGDIIEYKSGSVDYVEKMDKTGTIKQGELMVAREWGTVGIDGSYPSGDKVHYYKPQRGDVIYGKVAGSKAANCDIAIGDYLGRGVKTDAALSETTAIGNGTVAVAYEVHGTPGAGTDTAKIKFEVL